MKKGTGYMIDKSKAKWDFSKEEIFAIKWLEENGFEGRVEKQYVSKTIFTISKDGITQKFELPQGIVFKSISNYMEQFRHNWELTCELHRLRKEKECQVAINNTTYNYEGRAVISKDDEWANEKEWDGVFEQLKREQLVKD